MATDLSSVAIPHSEDIASVASAEVVTFDGGRVSMIRAYIDDAGGGTVIIGSGDAVQVAGQTWDTIWIAPRSPIIGTTTISITPGTTADVELRLY